MPTFDRVFGASIAAFAVLAPAHADTLTSPLTVEPGQPAAPWTRMSVDHILAANMNSRDVLVLSNFPLDANQTVTLALRRAEVFAPGATLQVTTEHGVEPLALPEDPAFVGHVVGFEDSLVAISISPDLVGGLIRIADQSWILSAGPASDGLVPVIVPFEHLPEALRTGHACAFDELAENAELKAQFPPLPQQENELPPFPCRMLDLAFETDRELLVTRFGGNQTQCTAYIQLQTAALTQIYTRNVNVRFRISFLNLWTSADPWDQGNTGNQLNQFRAWWLENRASVERDLAHFLSGRNLGGGVAWLGSVCNANAFALSANLAGFFPYPLVDHSGQNWDIMVTAHEIGHNIGSGHTHDIGSYDPIIDGCGNGDCSDAFNGTIMSYCHTCPGGMTNVNLDHHPRVNDRINYFLRTVTACPLSYNDSPVIIQQPQNTQACYGGPASLSVIADGQNMRYSWRFNGVIIPGANTAALAFPEFGPQHAGVYQVRIDTDCGGTLSNFVALTSTITVDCNTNGVCDEIDLARGDSTDANSNGIPDECDCQADLSGSADPLDPAYGESDGILDAADFFYFLDQFAAGNLNQADLTASADPLDPGYGNPDGVIDAADFFYFLDLFVEGCP